MNLLYHIRLQNGNEYKKAFLENLLQNTFTTLLSLVECANEVMSQQIERKILFRNLQKLWVVHI